MVIVDSSVWIHYLRTPDTATGRELDDLLAREEVSMVGLVMAEVLQGTKGEREYLQLLFRLQALPYLETGRSAWVRAASLSLQLRSRGQLTPLTDLIIAAVALENRCPLFTLDDHFQRIPELQLYKQEEA